MSFTNHKYRYTVPHQPSHFTSNLHSVRRKLENLSRCEANDNLLLSAAVSKNDEKILMEFRGKDMVATEVRYHPSCYKRYISKFTSRRTPVSGYNNHKESFKEFCSEVIEKRMMEQREILEMNTLTELFMKKVFEKEGIDITGYRNSCLKLRIQKLYSNVHFIKRSKVNSCELVTCETMNDNVCHLIYPSSTTERDSDEEEQSGALYVHSSHNLL